MEEQAIVAARASVMIYDDENKKWIHSGTSTGVSKVHIYQHMTQNTFRVVGRKLHDHELVINCSIIKGLKYNKATPTFHQWRDTKQVYGLNFSAKEDAENFASSMFKVLEVLNSAHNNLTGQIIINGNSAVMNNQLNQNLINSQQQQNQQPVYAHLNETQQQIIKQQYQAPPEYSEVIQTTNNRTNGWSNSNQVQLQSQISQPNSLDLNDWRAQQLQHDLNQLNLNGGTNHQQQQQVQQIMNSMQPIYGHHRNSLPNQANAQQQIQQNAQLIQAQHQQQLMHQQVNAHQMQISNGLQQPNLNQQLVQQQQQITSPPINVNQQIIISQQPTQPQQQNTLQSNQNNLNNSTQQPPNNIPQPPPAPSIPAPPPPPPMPTNLGPNKPLSTATTSSTTTSNQPTSNSLASALANAKLKKTPNKDELVKEKSSASLMDEMAKTLARRRAQAEGNHLNGNCNGNDDNDPSTSNRLKNGWVDKVGKSSPNKDNEIHSRLRAGSSDHVEFDVEKFKQDVIIEVKKEMNKIKLEILEAIKELNRNY